MTLWDILLSAALQHLRANGQHAIHPKVRRFSQNDRLRNVSLGVGAHLERIRAEEKNEETAARRYTGSRTCREVGASLSLMYSESDVEKLGKPQRNPRRKDANHRKWRAEKKKHPHAEKKSFKDSAGKPTKRDTFGANFGLFLRLSFLLAS